MSVSVQTVSLSTKYSGLQPAPLEVEKPFDWSDLNMTEGSSCQEAPSNKCYLLEGASTFTKLFSGLLLRRTCEIYLHHLTRQDSVKARYKMQTHKNKLNHTDSKIWPDNISGFRQPSVLR